MRTLTTNTLILYKHLSCGSGQLWRTPNVSEWPVNGRKERSTLRVLQSRLCNMVRIMKIRMMNWTIIYIATSVASYSVECLSNGNGVILNELRPEWLVVRHLPDNRKVRGSNYWWLLRKTCIHLFVRKDTRNGNTMCLISWKEAMLQWTRRPQSINKNNS